MSSIVYQRNKKSGTVYAYLAESYRDPDKGPRSRRRCIGRLDEETGEIVPTGKSGPRKHPENPATSIGNEQAPGQDQVSALKADLLRATERIQKLEQDLVEEQSKNKQMKRQMAKLKTRLENILKVWDDQT